MDQPLRPSPDTESKDRAGSSDPCSTRPNPFDEDDGSSARKRRRTSINGASSSRSVDTPPDSCSPPVAIEVILPSVDKDHGEDVTMTIDAASSVPQTPERHNQELPPISASKPKRVTLNYKSKREIPQSLSSSPMSQNDLDSVVMGPQENGIRLSVEDDDFDDPETCADFADTASSALEDTDDPHIEILDDEDEDDDDESDDGNNAVTVLNGPESNPMLSFPYQPNEPIVDSLPKLCLLLTSSKFAAINFHGTEALIRCPLDTTALCAFGRWMKAYVTWAGNVGTWEQHNYYGDYRDFWQALPQLVFGHTAPYKYVFPRSFHKRSRC